MKEKTPTDDQQNLECLRFNNDDLIIIDNLQSLPENKVYYTEHLTITICLSGKYQIDYDGVSTTVRQGEIFLGAPGTMMSDYMLSPNFSCKFLAIRPSGIIASAELHKQILNTMLYIKEHPVAPLTADDKICLLDYYNLICNRLKTSSDRYRDGEMRYLLNAFMLHVVGILGRQMTTIPDTTSMHGEQLVQRFVLLVNESNGTQRNVEHYANLLSITPKYLSTLVRTTLNRTPSEIIKMITIKEIERRLRYSDDSIKQISVDMNFPNTSFFGKYFKQHSGMTPNSYRKMYHK